MMSGCISMLSDLCRSSVILFERESALVSILSRGTSCGSVGFWSNWPLLLFIRFLSSREGPEFWTPLGLMSPLLAFVRLLLQDCVSLVSLLSLDRRWCSVSWSLPMHSSTCIGLPWILFCPLSWARQPVAVCSGWVLSFPVSLTSLAQCPVSPARFVSAGWTRSCRKLYVFRGHHCCSQGVNELWRSVPLLHPESSVLHAPLSQPLPGLWSILRVYGLPFSMPGCHHW